MTKIDKWIIYNKNKFHAIWNILTNRSVIYNLYFDKEHPLTLAPRNLTPDTLVTGCVFDGTGMPPVNTSEIVRLLDEATNDH